MAVDRLRGEEFWLAYVSQYISFHGFVASGS